MSVFAENVLLADGENPTDLLKGIWAHWYLVAISAESMREHGQKVYLDPDNQDREDQHASHTAVDGSKDGKTRKKLAEKYEWIVPPPNLYEPD
jgi:hypothetical protein